MDSLKFSGALIEVSGHAASALVTTDGAWIVKVSERPGGEAFT